MDIAVTTAPLRVNSQKEMGFCVAGDSEHDDVGAGPDGGQVATEVGASASAHHSRPGGPDLSCWRPAR